MKMKRNRTADRDAGFSDHHYQSNRLIYKKLIGKININSDID